MRAKDEKMREKMKRRGLEGREDERKQMRRHKKSRVAEEWKRVKSELDQGRR